MILKTSDRFQASDKVPTASPRRTMHRCHCDIFMRVGIGAMTDETGKVLQIKVTIQYSIANIEWLL